MSSRNYFSSESDVPPMKKLFPKLQDVEIEDAGHWLHSEKPHEFLKHTLAFLNANP